MRVSLFGVLLIFLALSCSSRQTETKPAASAQSSPVSMEKKETVKVKVEEVKRLADNRFSLLVRTLDDTSRLVECFPNFIRREGQALDMDMPANKKMLGLREMAPGTVLEMNLYWKQFKKPARALIMDFTPAQ
ncbi:MAG TPA: hypothetical protein ENJ15_06870 [Caldithrix abyssi]|uniref:Lipoprotein n=1 Tax=Caldithrix abyssi TaxID=187145 RepID=A0A7V5RQ66_CALAY|nr:hypothetical protein [Caldithrix abyssi]